jgi:hypothetical protein
VEGKIPGRVYRCYHDGENIAQHGQAVLMHTMAWAQLVRNNWQNAYLPWTELMDEEQELLEEQGKAPATGHVDEGDFTELEPTPEAVASLADMNYSPLSPLKRSPCPQHGNMQFTTTWGTMMSEMT